MLSFPRVSVRYNRLNYKSKSGCHPVYFRIYYKGRVDFVRVPGVPPLHESDWVGDPKHGVYVGHPGLNRLIVDAFTGLTGWLHEQAAGGRTPSIKEIKRRVVEPRLSQSFNGWCHYYIRNINRHRAPEDQLEHRTIQAYNSFLTKLDQFNPEIQFAEISTQLIDDFNYFLGAKHKLQSRTREKHFEKFKVCYRAAGVERVAKVDVDVFSKLRFKSVPSQKVSLTLEEVRLFKTTPLTTPTAEKCKNIFLFACLTGLYYNDVRGLRKGNIEKVVVDGETIYAIVARRYKNDRDYAAPLFEDAIAILDKHSTWKSLENASDILFPDLISDVKFNKMLKEIARQLGIDKNLTGKVARFTYAELSSSMGLSNEKIARAMGHSNIKTTQHYSKLSKANALRGWKPIRL